jgi:hypothetical protein
MLVARVYNRNTLGPTFKCIYIKRVRARSLVLRLKLDFSAREVALSYSKEHYTLNDWIFLRDNIRMLSPKFCLSISNRWISHLFDEALLSTGSERALLSDPALSILSCLEYHLFNGFDAISISRMN